MIDMEVCGTYNIAILITENNYHEHCPSFCARSCLEIVIVVLVVHRPCTVVHYVHTCNRLYSIYMKMSVTYHIGSTRRKPGVRAKSVSRSKGQVSVSEAGVRRAACYD
jgi:hypothetical protein